jgi:NAD(P)-dependent dehydrogenase (short-subunit alcohol dehydrogenase family)
MNSAFSRDASSSGGLPVSTASPSGSDLDLWDRLMTVNLRGYVVAMKAATPLMSARGGGAIVNMSSAAAFQGEPTRPAYATAKAGIGALTRHVASRWGKDGIR